MDVPDVLKQSLSKTILFSRVCKRPEKAPQRIALPGRPCARVVVLGLGWVIAATLGFSFVWSRRPDRVVLRRPIIGVSTTVAERSWRPDSKAT